MDLSQLKRPTDWFRVHSLRHLDDPSGQMDRKELVVPLDQYPVGLGLGPNPRRPDLSSRVSKNIEETLRENGRNFHLLNRGITIVAKSIEYDNKTEKVRLRLHESEEEEPFYGILDGGNTDARIKKWREDLPDEDAKAELARRYVNVQVLAPKLKDLSVPTGELVDLMHDIQDARNTSVQVKAKSLADARHHFDLLKEVLAGEPYFGEISWREGDKGRIDALLLLSLLMVFYPRFSESFPGQEPSNAYGRKERCLDAYLQYSEENGEELDKWIQIVPELIRLFDEVQTSFPEHYTGHFGKINEVQIFDERRYEKGNKRYRKTAPTSYFFGEEMKYSYPTGWLYPVFAGFRVLAGLNKTSEAVVWKRDPMEFWRAHGREIVAKYQPHLQQWGHETKRVASDTLCYQAMRSTVTGLYKDELLKEAGITI